VPAIRNDSPSGSKGGANFAPSLAIQGLCPLTTLSACSVLPDNQAMQRIEMRTIPRVGLDLTSLALGTAPLAGMYRDVSYADCEAAFELAFQQGIRFFDTAAMYGRGKAEHYLGHFLRTRNLGDQVVVSTKAGRLMRPNHKAPPPPPEKNPFDGGWTNPLPFEEEFDYSYDGVMRSLEDSLQRLGLDAVDILFIHDIGRMTHQSQHGHYWSQLSKGGFRALDELRSGGVVKAVGLGVNEWQAIKDAMPEFDLDCSLLAGRYTLLDQSALDSLFPECQRRRVAIIMGGVFNSGILAGGSAGRVLKYNYQPASQAVVERVQAIERVCADHRILLRTAALQFPFAHPLVASVVEGCQNAAEVAENFASLQTDIPTGFWSDLKLQGLLHPEAPVPQ
jgi:D-threo-aldose 1-dehydrogenase